MTELFYGLGILTAGLIVLSAVALLGIFVSDTLIKWRNYSDGEKWHALALQYLAERDEAREALETLKTKCGYR